MTNCLAASFSHSVSVPGDEGDHAPADIEKSYLEELNDFVEAAFLKKMADLQDLEALKLRPKQKEADDADAAQVQKEKEKDEKAFTDILETGQHDSTEAKVMPPYSDLEASLIRHE